MPQTKCINFYLSGKELAGIKRIFACANFVVRTRSKVKKEAKMAFDHA